LSERRTRRWPDGVASESLATRVRLIFAGWLPQDGLFGWKRPQL
jgi:hypothetical protein